MDRVEETTDEDEVSFAPTPSPEEARARLAALRGRPLDAPSRLVTDEAAPDLDAAIPASPSAQPEVVTSPAAPKSSVEVMPVAMLAAWQKFLDGEALTAERQKAASAVKKADKPLFKVIKVRITTRIDADVLEAFKAEGDGWQTRINDVLRANMPRSAPIAGD